MLCTGLTVDHSYGEARPYPHVTLCPAAVNPERGDDDDSSVTFLGAVRAADAFAANLVRGARHHVRKGIPPPPPIGLHEAHRPPWSVTRGSFGFGLATCVTYGTNLTFRGGFNSAVMRPTISLL